MSNFMGKFQITHFLKKCNRHNNKNQCDIRKEYRFRTRLIWVWIPTSQFSKQGKLLNCQGLSIFHLQTIFTLQGSTKIEWDNVSKALAYLDLLLVIGFMITTGYYSIKTQFCDTLESPFPPLSLCSQKNHQSHQSLPGHTVTKIHPLISIFPGQILSQCWITSYFTYYKWILASLHISELVKILPIRKTWFFSNCAGPLLFFFF